MTFRGFDKYVDLLANIKRRIARAGKGVNDLQHSGINPLGAGSC
jgi:hypothetical protein